MLIIRLCILIGILLFSSTSHSSINSPSPTNIPIKKVMIEAAKRWNVEPAFLMSVACIESRKGNQEFRLGKMGKTYYGPMGIHKCFLNRWAIDDWKINIEVGARALRGVENNEQLQKRRLKRYNVSFNNSYWKAICSMKYKYQKELPLIK